MRYNEVIEILRENLCYDMPTTDHGAIAALTLSLLIVMFLIISLAWRAGDGDERDTK